MKTIKKLSKKQLRGQILNFLNQHSLQNHQNSLLSVHSSIRQKNQNPQVLLNITRENLKFVIQESHSWSADLTSILSKRSETLAKKNQPSLNLIKKEPLNLNLKYPLKLVYQKTSENGFQFDLNSSFSLHNSYFVKKHCFKTYPVNFKTLALKFALTFRDE